MGMIPYIYKAWKLKARYEEHPGIRERVYSETATSTEKKKISKCKARAIFERHHPRSSKRIVKGRRRKRNKSPEKLLPLKGGGGGTPSQKRPHTLVGYETLNTGERTRRT